MPSLPRMWPRIVSPPRRLAAQQRVVLHHADDDVLEAHRRLEALLAQMLRQPVEQMRGGEVAHHSAALAAHLVHIPIQQQQDVVDRDVLAALVHDRDPVGIAVRRQPKVVVPFLHLRTQQPQRLQFGAGERPPNSGLWRSWMNVTRQRASVRMVPSVSCPTPYIGSTMTFSPAWRISLEIDQRLHRVHVFVGEIALLDDAGFQREIQLQLDDVVRR